MIKLERHFAVDGVELAWDRWGPEAGRPFVLCHGFSGSAHDFALHLPALAEHRRVVALDHRGHGRSTKTGDPGSYTLDRLTADLVAFLAHLDAGPVDLLGHSMGGRLVMNVAIARPDLVHSLVLMDTTAADFTPDEDMARFMREFLSAFDPAQGLPDLMGMRGPEDDLIDATVPAEWNERKRELSAGFDPAALKGLGAEMLGGQVPSALQDIAAYDRTATVIVGEHDQPFARHAPELVAALPHGHLEVIAGAWHSPQLTHPAEWRAAIDRHLQRADAASA